MTQTRPGRHSLYSASDRRPFSCTVECSSCREETRVGYLELAALMFPFSLHLPVIKQYHSYLRCPACGRRTWQKIHLGR
jgi:hypothetical protein